MTGSQEPRIRIEPERFGTDGPDAGLMMSEYGVPLDPWQQSVLDCWLGKDQYGEYNVTSAGLALPRQNVIIAYPLYLYKYGDTCDSVTGGWYAKAWRWTSNTASAKAPTITHNSDNVVVSIYNGGGAMVTRNAFDVTYYNTVKIRGFYAGDDASPGAILNNTTANYYIDAVAVQTNVSSQTTSDNYIDISSVKGQKYFCFEVSKVNATRSLTIYEVVLER